MNYIPGPVYSVSDRLLTCIENILQETAVVLVAGPSHVPTEAELEDDDFEGPKKKNILRSRKNKIKNKVILKLHLRYSALWFNSTG